MARATFVWRDGELVDKRHAAPLTTIFGRAPGIIRDGMDAIRHPCTGKLMDSKAAFRAVTRAHGCEEIGSESPVIKPAVSERVYSDDLKRDIHDAIEATEHLPAGSFESVLGEGAAPAPATDGWA